MFMITLNHVHRVICFYQGIFDYDIYISNKLMKIFSDVNFADISNNKIWVFQIYVDQTYTY